MDGKRRRFDDADGGRDSKRAYRGFTSSWSLKNNGTEANGGPAAKAKVDEGGSGDKDRPVTKILKACQSCRRSKLRCESQNKTKCKRCEEQGLECVYEMKVPTNATAVPDADWMSTVESRLDSFGSTLSTIVSLLQQGGQPQLPFESNASQMSVLSVGGQGSPPRHSLMDQPANENGTPQSRDDFSQVTPSADFYSVNSSFSYSGDDELRKILDEFEDLDKNTALSALTVAQLPNNVVDLRTNGTLSFEQAQELFSFFHQKISPHLFGFSTSHLELPNVWARSPILVAAICTVAAVHHSKLNHLFQPLKRELDGLARQVLFSDITTETEAVDTIVALCVAGFWLQDSSMLTAMALRLARSVGLNLPQKGNSKEATEQRLRLWYLIYILDGHQSLTYNQPPLIESHDKAASIARSLLLKKTSSVGGPQAQLLRKILVANGSMGQQEELRRENDQFDFIGTDTLLSDIRLVSQVEFNQAVKSIFQDSAWDIISPQAIGVPWKTNVELDKWMVAWACLLTPSDSGQDSWSSKSTLIHYNFAKMHINSSRIRQLQQSNSLTGTKGKNKGHMGTLSYPSGDIDKSSDSIALSAAQSVVRLSTSDSDILDALQFVPIHVHIMLYYAAMLILGSVSAQSSPRAVRDAFRLVRDLRTALFSCQPRYDDLIGDITNNLNDELSSKSSEVADVLALRCDDQNDVQTTRTIAAWPGSISSHLDS